MPQATVLITGASRGIGLALCERFSRENWQVIAAAREPKRSVELQQLCVERPNVTAVALDVLDYGAIERLAAGLHNQEPGRTIDILINNAGIIGEPDGGRPAAFEQIDYAAWRQTFEVNTIAPAKVSAAFLKHVAASRRKVIAFISSSMGSISAEESGGYYAYRSSKAALNRVVRCLAVDLRPMNITPVAVHPGWVRTAMGSDAAPLSPAESAAGLFNVLTSLKQDDAGKFLGYDGAEIPW